MGFDQVDFARMGQVQMTSGRSHSSCSAAILLRGRSHLFDRCLGYNKWVRRILLRGPTLDAH
jgi:hypothetical protein